MKFNCDGCGACCKEIGTILYNAKISDNIDPELKKELLSFPYSFDSTGRCEKLNENNKCSIYKERPNCCNVEYMYRYYRSFTKRQYYDATTIICNELKLIHDR
jgi:Fe-S-cluster containining protein